MAKIHRLTPFPVPTRELYDFHTREGAFERAGPPWKPAQVLKRPASLESGDLVFQIRMGPIPFTWVARHSDHIEGQQFRDTLASFFPGLLSWTHVHRMRPGPDASTSVLEDDVTFRAWPGMTWLIRAEFERMFDFRARRLPWDAQRHAAWSRPVRRVAITGASGMVGTALAAFLSSGGHEVHRLVRRPARHGQREIFWNPDSGEIDAASLEGFDAVVHLAGTTVATRWTERAMRDIRESRVKGTSLLARTLAGLSRPPRMLISASGIGIYGKDRGTEELTEASTLGTDFLAEVGQAWEAAADPARQAGIRVVHPRIGMVLSPSGGALAKMLPAFLAGGGGRLGSGRQMISWISLEDLVGVMLFCIAREDVSGPINAVTPHAVSNAEFTRTLGRVLKRPTIFPVPGFALRLIFGGMADALLLGGQQARPAALQQAGFPFLLPQLEQALRHELGR